MHVISEATTAGFPDQFAEATKVPPLLGRRLADPVRELCTQNTVYALGTLITDDYLELLHITIAPFQSDLSPSILSGTPTPSCRVVKHAEVDVLRMVQRQIESHLLAPLRAITEIHTTLKTLPENSSQAPPRGAVETQ